LNPIFYREISNANKSWFSQTDPTVDFKGTAFIGRDVTIEEHCRIGDSVSIGHHTCIRANTIIEDYVFIGSHVIFETIQGINWQRNKDIEREPIIIKKAARIMSGTILLPGITIGVNSLIGSGSMITRNVPNGEIWYGHPAKKRGLVDPTDIPIEMLKKETFDI